jgi:hypothetical protein
VLVARKALIITDDGPEIKKITGEIAKAFGKLPFEGYQALIVSAGSLTPVDLLPAHVFFLGGSPLEPSPFGRIEGLFRHINLAGRPCGVFSSNQKTLDYLSKLAHSSGAAQCWPLLAEGGLIEGGKIQNWLQLLMGDKNERF